MGTHLAKCVIMGKNSLPRTVRMFGVRSKKADILWAQNIFSNQSRGSTNLHKTGGKFMGEGAQKAQ